MTGTSIDGIDAALVEVGGVGLEMTARHVGAISRSLGVLAADLRKLADQQPMTARRVTELMWELGELHASVAQELGTKWAGGRRIDLVCVHGQTVYHGKGRTWQLMQPAPIAVTLGAPVVFDLRAADIAAGGQGAPITPIADWILFRDARTSRALVNLGGFCNVTRVPAGLEAARLAGVRGQDVCACNQLLDGLSRVRLGRKFDENGEIAGRGKVISGALESLEQILKSQTSAGRSLGTGDELAGWISATAAQPGPDVVRTACEAVGRAIAAAVTAKLPGTTGVDEIVLAGGGVKNATLVAAITRAAGEMSEGRAVGVKATDALGVPAAYREAIEFAILGALCQDRVGITLAGVTGRREPAPVCGAWVYP